MTVINIITMLIKTMKGVNNVKLAYGAIMNPTLMSIDVIIITSNDTTMTSKTKMTPLLMRMARNITINKRRMTT